MYDFKIPLGATVCDKISQFEGIVTRAQEHLNGPIEYQVQKKGLDENDRPYNPIVFFEDDLFVISETTEINLRRANNG